jgi:hypothetical protein
MRKVVVLVGLAAMVLVASGCASQPKSSQKPSPSASQTQEQHLPTVDPSLIPPTAPSTVIDVDPASYLEPTGDYVFRVGVGPTWCTISPSSEMAICEQSEISAQYVPIPIPSSCEYSYGYQVELKSVTTTDGSPTAFFPCSGGAFTDPAGALTLEDGQRISVAPFNCYVAGQTARCENQEGAYIVLGPKAWALGQNANQ